MANAHNIYHHLWKNSIVLSATFLLLGTQAQAQKTKPKNKDKNTTQLNLDNKDKDVTITSEYTPSLKESSKINFNGTPAPLPSDKAPNMNYNIPGQNLFFPYTPGSLRPLSYTIKDTTRWHNDGFIKAGYGNYHAPYLEGGLALGDGVNSAVSIYAKHTQGKGHLPLQKYANTEASANGVFQLNDNLEMNGKLYFDQKTRYAYGIRPADSLLLNSDSAKIKYATYGVKLGLRNKKENEFGINYAPTIGINMFSTNQNAHESSLDINAPFSKTINDNINFDLGFRADVTSLKNNTADTTIKNNIFYINPALTYKTDNIKVHVGWSPSWSQGNFKGLADLGFEAKIPDVRFLVFGGYKSYYNKNTYQTLSHFNNWISVPTALKNTRSNQLFGGLKGSVGSHITYLGKVAYIKMYNQSLFTNQYYLGNRFNVVYEPKMTDLQIHGEVEYTEAEKFSLLAGITANNYTKLQENDKAWGLIPFELNASLRWQLIHHLWLKSDLDLFNGNHYLALNGSAQTTKAVADLNAGLEYKFTKNFSIWSNVNNILNKQYQRWNQYQVFGTQFQAGLIWNFDMKK